MNKDKLMEHAVQVIVHAGAIVLASCLMAWFLPGISH
jgi:hypothetical protein